MGVAAADMPSLPEDPTALRALLLSVIAERDSLTAERDALAVSTARGISPEVGR